MAQKKKPKRQETKAQSTPGFRVTFTRDSKKGSEGVVVAQGSSNYYTSQNYNSDTCCSCEKQ